MVSQAELILRIITLGSWSYLIFLEKVWVTLNLTLNLLSLFFSNIVKHDSYYTESFVFSYLWWLKLVALALLFTFLTYCQNRWYFLLHGRILPEKGGYSTVLRQLQQLFLVC